MNTITRHYLICGAIAALGLVGAAVHAQNAPAVTPRANTTTTVATPAVEKPATPPKAAAVPAAPVPDVEAPDVEDRDPDDARSSNDSAGATADEPPMVWNRSNQRWRPRHFRGDNDDATVTVFGSSTLLAGQRSDAVVSVFGSSTSEGIVRNAVVSVFGNTRVDGGTVGDASVSVFGDNYVNAPVQGDVVAVLGSVELGPNAKVRGNVVVVGGELKRDPAAEISGGVQNVMSLPAGALLGIRSWFENCVRYLRPLAFAHDLGWAWTIALGFLGFYALLALLFRGPLDRCVKTLQDHPGHTIIASLLSVVLTPVLYVVLCITVIGIAFIPIISFAMFLATWFGKAVVLAWIGRGVLKLVDDDQKLHSAIAVLAGGAIVLLLYVVPVLGFLLYNVLGLLALGVVIYTLLLEMKSRRRTSPPPSFRAGTTRPATPDAPGGSAFASGPAAGAGAFAVAGDPPIGAVPYTAGFSTAEGTPEGDLPPNNGGMAADAVSLPRAGFWIRMLALGIDAIIIGVAMNMFDHHHRLQLIALAAYGAIMWKLKGTTVGGIVCSLKVVRTDGRPVDWSTAIVRALGCFLSLVVCGLGFIWIAFDEGRQSWHDKIAGTAVVRVPQGVSLL